MSMCKARTLKTKTLRKVAMGDRKKNTKQNEEPEEN